MRHFQWWSSEDFLNRHYNCFLHRQTFRHEGRIVVYLLSICYNHSSLIIFHTITKRMWPFWNSRESIYINLHPILKRRFPSQIPPIFLTDFVWVPARQSWSQVLEAIFKHLISSNKLTNRSIIWAGLTLQFQMLVISVSPNKPNNN